MDFFLVVCMCENQSCFNFCHVSLICAKYGNSGGPLVNLVSNVR